MRFPFEGNKMMKKMGRRIWVAFALLAVGILGSSSMADSKKNVGTGYLTKGEHHMKDEAGKKIEMPDPANDPVGLLRVLGKIHEAGLLLNSEFISNERIAALFGSGSIEIVDYEDSSVVVKRMKSDSGNSLNAEFSFLQKYYDENSESKTTGWLKVSPYDGNSYELELIEKYLTKDIEGKDFLKEKVDASADIHAHESYAKRPPSTHPKGYFVYQEDRRDRDCFSSLRVRLDANARLSDITIDQSCK
ncbi:hypothetical protein [Herbaspirillum seropedicae]|uniref:hypothetical protein n=1 Tax=Herbaspirillum seropedicae TaxID=964 RepID=UPI00286B0512|nr:hypothetical protein [Herbaspirillum seropedicae]